MTFKKFKCLVSSDLKRYRGLSGIKGFVQAYFLFPGFRVTFWYRLTRYSQLVGCSTFFCRLLTAMHLRQQYRFGIELNPGSDVGPGLYMPHPGNIVISPRSRIGANCYISHGVTLGKAHSGERAGAPQLGNDVFIGPGAKLIGQLIVGDNAAIGANSVVVDDVVDNCFVAGIPAKKINEQGATRILGYEID